MKVWHLLLIMIGLVILAVVLLTPRPAEHTTTVKPGVVTTFKNVRMPLQGSDVDINDPNIRISE